MPRHGQDDEDPTDPGFGHHGRDPRRAPPPQGGPSGEPNPFGPRSHLPLSPVPPGPVPPGPAPSGPVPSGPAAPPERRGTVYGAPPPPPGTPYPLDQQQTEQFPPPYLPYRPGPPGPRPGGYPQRQRPYERPEPAEAGGYAPARRSGRHAARTAVIAATSVLLILGLGAVGWAMLNPTPAPGYEAPKDALAATASSSVDPTTLDPTTITVTTTPAPIKTTVKPRPKPTPTKKPPKAAIPPAPPKPAYSPPAPDCVKDPGPDASNADVKAALAAAGARHFWVGVVPPSGIDDATKAAIKQLDVSASLMRAIAFTESSWRSSVVSCDGGVGLMQIMANNETYLNGRFGESYDRTKMADNAMLGSAYLQWLTAYFGIYYFDDTFTMSATTTHTDDGTPMTLEDVVLAAYNVGVANVENTHGTDTGSDDTLSIPNQWYVDRVHTNLTSCPCAGW